MSADKVDRMDPEARAAFIKWSHGKSAAVKTKMLGKCAVLGLKNRNGRIGKPEVKKAISGK